MTRNVYETTLFSLCGDPLPLSSQIELGRLALAAGQRADEAVGTRRLRGITILTSGAVCLCCTTFIGTDYGVGGPALVAAKERPRPRCRGRTRGRCRTWGRGRTIRDINRTVTLFTLSIIAFKCIPLKRSAAHSIFCVGTAVVEC